jgi:WD40 repeat protein
MGDGDEGHNIEIGGDANSSTIISGDRAIITITNYYYREDTEIATAESVDNSDLDLPCPYRGLFHFEPNDAEWFYGRDVFVTELLTATQNRNFIPILGASGSGKSSVVFAGLVPKLEKLGHWRFTHFRPGTAPFHALALALIPLYTIDLNATERLAQSRQLAAYLRDGNVLLADIFKQIQQYHPQDRVLLIADQFEELYTLCNDEKIRCSFLDILLAGFQSLSSNSQFSPILVATMRVDFLKNALSYPPFADVLRNADIIIRSMNPQELSEVIEKPAQKLGVSFEAGLVERILDEVENQPGNLPLLEFALTELWKQRTGKQLTHAAYEAIGEIKGALAKYADEKYRNLSKIEQEQARRIFIQLVRPGEGTEDTRRRATQTELGEISWDLVSKLATARLVVTSENADKQNTVEVVHEALIQNWGTLQEWMKTDRTFRAWQERLRGAKDRWAEMDRDEGSLLRGAALAEAEEKLNERPEDLRAEQEFIEQSIKERDREKQEQENRRQRDLRISRRIAVGSIIAAVVSTGLGVTAWWQSRQAEQNQAEAVALSASVLNTSGKHLDALIFGIKAGKIFKKYDYDGRNQAYRTLRETLTEILLNIRERNRLIGYSGDIHVIGDSPVIAFSPDSKTIISGGFDKTVRIWDVATGKLRYPILQHDAPISSLTFSPKGETIASGSQDGIIKLWNADKRELMQTLKHEGGICSASDRKREGICKDMIVTIGTFYFGQVTSLAFSPEGDTIASGSLDNTVRTWDVASGRRIHTYKHDAAINSMAFSPKGDTIASFSEENIKLWNIDNEKKPLYTFVHKREDDPQINVGLPSVVRFRPKDPTFVASMSPYSKTIRLWNTINNKPPILFQGHKDLIKTMSFCSDGTTIASGSVDKTVRIWNAASGRQLHILEGHKIPVSTVEFSKDCKIVASSGDGKIIKADPVRGTTVESYFEGDSTIKLWNANSGKFLVDLKGHKRGISMVTFSLDGTRMASASTDGTVQLWDITDDRSKPLNSQDRRQDEQTKLYEDLDSLMKKACDWSGNYLRYSKDIKEGSDDRKLCDDIQSQ